CGLMSGKIYCYGGTRFTTATDTTADTVMNVLDITNKSGTLSSDLQNLWRSVPYVEGDVAFTPRSYPQCVVISDQNRMIVNGGLSIRGAQPENTNMMYDALQNQWFAQPVYTEPPYGKRQIYWGSSSYVPGKGAAFYGGFEIFINPNWTTPNVNASIFSFADGLSREIGYTQVSYLNVDNPSSAWSTGLPLTTPSDQFLVRHQSIFDPATNMLLFMGGVSRATSKEIIVNSYLYIKTFNTLTNEWGAMNLTGDRPTPKREYSTLTLLPSTNRHVLLYGGEADDAVVQDYCNVLNLDTKIWTRQTINAPAETILQRSRHSSVLVSNNTLFVMWGIEPNKVGLSSVLVLNTTNPDAITMSNKYIDPNAPNAAEDSNDNTFKPGGNSAGDPAFTGLSSGAKAGIVVAAVVVAFLGALVIWFYLRNKRNKRLRDQEHELRKQQEADYYHATDVEPMEVDWDQIETKYTEMPATRVANNNNNEQFGSIRDSTPSTTIVNGGKPDSAAAYVVHPDAADVQQPNAIDSSSQAQRVLKPDGGYNKFF
ncbi:hypothetical protein MBANPS3_012428, partial [Mucor bainieri]